MDMPDACILFALLFSNDKRYLNPLNEVSRHLLGTDYSHYSLSFYTYLEYNKAG